MAGSGAFARNATIVRTEQSESSEEEVCGVAAARPSAKTTDFRVAKNGLAYLSSALLL